MATPQRGHRPSAPSARSALRDLAQAAGSVEHLARSVASKLTPSMAVGAVVEAAWLSTHVLTYPIGLVHGRGSRPQQGYRIEHLPPVQRGLLMSNLEAADTPILLVHGLIDNRSIFTLLRLGLTRRGFGSIFAMNYSPLTADVRTAAIRLAEEVEAICEETGYERIHLIGHSLGGLIARYYITRLGGDERVHTCVTLGTPHSGTWVAYLLPLNLTRQMRPDSSLLRELEEPVPHCQTRFLVYWSDADQLVVPQSNGQLTHPDLTARNVKLTAIGHASLPIVGSVVHGISEALAHLDHDGSTQAPGAIPLGRSHPA